MNRSIKMFSVFILTVGFCVFIFGCSNKSMFMDQAKSVVTAFDDNGIYFPDLNENVLADIIETAYVEEYNKRYESYDYELSFEAAETFQINSAEFTGGIDAGSKEYAGQLKRFILDSLKKIENIETKKNYSVKCKFEQDNGGWICKIDTEDIDRIKSGFDLYANELFEKEIEGSQEYRTILEKEFEPYIADHIISELSYPAQFHIKHFDNVSSTTAGVGVSVAAPDFSDYRIENPDALFPDFNFKSLTANVLEDYRNILYKNLKNAAEKNETGVMPYSIFLMFTRGDDGIWECDTTLPLRSVSEINGIIESQTESVIKKAEEESDILQILSRHYRGRLFHDYPEYLNCSELADFIKVEDIKLSGSGKYEITLKYPALDELIKVAETNFLNSITKKYYDTDEISFNKNNIANFYNKDEVAKIKAVDTVAFTYDRHSAAVVSDKSINEKFEMMINNAVEEANAKWLVNERSFPSSGLLYNNSGGGNSFINFYKFPGADVCFYKLYNSSDKLIVTIFLNTDSDSVGLYLPSGSYYLKYSYGSKWYGPEDAFGSSGNYGKSESFVVLYGYMYDYTFVYSGGNTDLNSIDRGDF